MICYAIRLKQIGKLLRNSGGKIYTFKDHRKAERMANICYSSKMYEIVKVEG